MPRTVADAMRTPAVTLEPSVTIQEASARMLEAAVHVAVVVDDGRVCGLVTADGFSAALRAGHDPAATPVGAVAERDPPLVGVDDALAEAHLRMRAVGRALAPVVAPDRRPVGILEDSSALG